jgi:hypothetical protein
MFKTYQQADGRAMMKRVFGASPEPVALAQTFHGPASAKLHSMAIDEQRADPRASYAGAYARIYTDPKNEALRNAAKDEHMRVMLGLSGSDIDEPKATPGPGSLSIQQAQQLEPAPKFPNAPGRAYG